MNRIPSVAGIFLFILLASITLAAKACETPTCLSRFLIPQGYVGWVVVYYNIKDAPPTVKEDGREVFRISPQGRVETRSRDIAPCYMDSDFYFVEADGTRKPLEKTPNREYKLILRELSGVYGSGSDDEADRQYYTAFFVGTQEQYDSGKYKLKERRPQDID